jgi:hypothetical protein
LRVEEPLSMIAHVFDGPWTDRMLEHARKRLSKKARKGFRGCNCSTHPSTRKQLIINEILVGQIRRGGSIESGPK